jgi:hypothetical protein
MSGWTIAKYALVLAGLALVFGADRLGARWAGYPGLGLIVVAFLLRYLQRRAQRRPPPPTDPGAV